MIHFKVIEKLSSEINNQLAALAKVNELPFVNHGITPKIDIQEAVTSIHDAAYIKGNLFQYALEGKEAKVTIYENFLQYIWLMHYVAILLFDHREILTEVNKMTKEELKQFSKELSLCPQDFKNLFHAHLNHTEIVQDVISKISYAETLRLYGLNQQEIADVNKFELNHTYQLKANGMFISSVVYILLHEYSHFGQSINMSNWDCEFMADSDAFLKMYKLAIDILYKNNVQWKKTVQYAIIGTFCVLLFLCEGNGQSDTHPSIIKRLMAYMDFAKKDITEKHYKFANFYMMLWAKAMGIQDFPQEGIDSNKVFEEMCNYIENYSNKKNDSSKISLHTSNISNIYASHMQNTSLRKRNNLIENVIRKSRNWEIDQITDTRIDVVWKKDGTFMKYGVASIYISSQLQLQIMYSTRFTAKLSNDMMKSFITSFRQSVWRTIGETLHKNNVFPKKRTLHKQSNVFIYQLKH